MFSRRRSLPRPDHHSLSILVLAQNHAAWSTMDKLCDPHSATTAQAHFLGQARRLLQPTPFASLPHDAASRPMKGHLQK